MVFHDAPLFCDLARQGTFRALGTLICIKFSSSERACVKRAQPWPEASCRFEPTILKHLPVQSDSTSGDVDELRDRLACGGLRVLKRRVSSGEMTGRRHLLDQRSVFQPLPWPSSTRRAATDRPPGRRLHTRGCGHIHTPRHPALPCAFFRVQISHGGPGCETPVLAPP